MFGFGKPTGIDIQGESHGVVPTTNYMNKILGKRLNKNINKHELFKLKDIS